jgi:hypothetical protein
MSHDQIARNGYEANPLNTSSAPQMRTKFELAEANAQRARYSNQHSSISASPLPHISTRDIFDAGSSHSGNTVDTSNSGHAAEIPFAQNLRLENNSHILATGYSTALWPSTLLQTGTPATAGANLHNTTGQDWWQNPLHCAPKGTFQAQYGMSPHHGLPQYAEERFTSVWSYGPDLCTTQMITMNQPQVQTFGYDAPMAMSTSDSSQGSISDSYAASTYEQSLQDDDDNESFTTQQRRDLPSSHSDREYHTKAPDCKAAQRHVPVLPNNNHALKTEDGDEWQARKKGTRSTMSEGAVTYSIHMGDQSPQVTSTKSKTGRSRAARHSWNAGDKLAVVDEKKQDRTEKDTFLIQSKLAGMSYKEIRRKGNFTEAESTLRGRFRTLTKHKAARVRKPEWDENDVSTASNCFIHWLIREGSFATQSCSKICQKCGSLQSEDTMEAGGGIYCGPWWFLSFWKCYMSKALGRHFRIWVNPCNSYCMCGVDQPLSFVSGS